MYYFGSYYTQKQFSLSFAFDSMTEEQFNFLTELFGDKKIHPLIFDEKPYKIYQAKVTGNTMIKYIPFTENKTNRIYKGEGSVQFTCYQPYAICTKKYLDEYDSENIQEWQESSNLLSTKGQLDELIEDYILVYNPGVKETDWIMEFFATEGNQFCGGKIKIDDDCLIFSGCAAKTSYKEGKIYTDEKITFDSKTELIEGWYPSKIDENDVILEYTKSGNIYNEYITGGDFFKIPVTIKKNNKNEVQKEFKKIYILADEKEESLKDYFNSLNYYYYYY